MKKFIIKFLVSLLADEFQALNEKVKKLEAELAGLTDEDEIRDLIDRVDDLERNQVDEDDIEDKIQMAKDEIEDQFQNGIDRLESGIEDLDERIDKLAALARPDEKRDK